MTDTSGNIGWTPLSGVPFNHYEGEPGQTFTEDQLPHPEVQRAAGINPDLYRMQHGLYVEPAAGPMPVFTGTENGLEPSETLRKTGNVESFASSIPEPVAPPVELSVDLTDVPAEDIIIELADEPATVPETVTE